jgi:hypothetical protein
MQKSRTRKKWIIVVITALVMLPVGYLVLRILGDRLNRHLIDAVGFREGIATVVRKEVVKFDERNHSYTNDHGDRVEAQPGDTQYRVYYKHDEFNGYEEPFRGQLMQAEGKRISEGKPHFAWKNYNDRSWYDTIQVGDKLIVSYRAYSDGYIEVVSVKKSPS